MYGNRLNCWAMFSIKFVLAESINSIWIPLWMSLTWGCLHVCEILWRYYSFGPSAHYLHVYTYVHVGLIWSIPLSVDCGASPCNKHSQFRQILVFATAPLLNLSAPPWLPWWKNLEPPLLKRIWRWNINLNNMIVYLVSAIVTLAQ